MIDLEAIRERRAAGPCSTSCDGDIDALLAEVERLRAIEDRLDAAICLHLSLDPDGPGDCTDRLVAAVELAGQRLSDLQDTLERLVDWQNGCPLPSYEKEWTRAMADAARLLGRSPPQ